MRIASHPVQRPSSRIPHRERGLTLVELIVTVAILSILAGAALPVARFQVKRQNERELRRDLWMMRDAIDHYKDAADRGAFQTKVDSQNYPPDLETLVKGVDVQSKKVRFLRKIPVDPMTGRAMETGSQPRALAMVMMMGIMMMVRTVLEVVSRWLYIITAMMMVKAAPNGMVRRFMPPNRERTPHSAAPEDSRASPPA